LNKPEVAAFNKENQELYDYIANKSGVLATMSGVLGAFDQIHCLKSSGYTIPDWVTDDYYNAMANVWYCICISIFGLRANFRSR